MYLTQLICGIAMLSLADGSTDWSVGQRDEKNVAHMMISSSTESYDGPIEDAEEHIFFRLFTRSTNITVGHLMVNNADYLKLSDFDPARPTLIVIPGFLSTLQSHFFLNMKKAALASHDFNVIGVDWSFYTNDVNYAKSVAHVKPAGVFVSEFIEFLMTIGLSRGNVHLIGHSLGSHVAGHAGKQLTANGHPPGRITGLDPALPGFYNVIEPSKRLDGKDADYVDCIHTCGALLGIPTAICQADFYPNNGVNTQPGCPLHDLVASPADAIKTSQGVIAQVDIADHSVVSAGKFTLRKEHFTGDSATCCACSHGRAHEFFAESFNASHIFSAKSCAMMMGMVPVICIDKGAVMGYPAGVEKYQGLFYLSTNKQAPFAENVTTH